ncbi:MAG: hypothetical protein PVI30_00795 [Myxococcales bacterium]
MGRIVAIALVTCAAFTLSCVVPAAAALAQGSTPAEAADVAVHVAPAELSSGSTGAGPGTGAELLPNLALDPEGAEEDPDPLENAAELWLLAPRWQLGAPLRPHAPPGRDAGECVFRPPRA